MKVCVSVRNIELADESCMHVFPTQLSNALEKQCGGNAQQYVFLENKNHVCDWKDVAANAVQRLMEMEAFFLSQLFFWG